MPTRTPSKKAPTTKLELIRQSRISNSEIPSIELFLRDESEDDDDE